ncbi:ammonium transporter [Planctomyces sp. SH-PL62]|uniref:ammonium transporter n=1 Tax=Planctomyces sp. SH-PL62 TaxID=1636152 RepID=UPI00078D0EC9|nr:ammonium transporter [Planctomyces sp. SH-PL62]AMV38049.1 Ammonium transporter NrgA [Planctomyces sp. SH-PL62]
MIDRADALLVMTCAALALLLTPAMGLIFAGLVRRKNALSAFLGCLTPLGIVAVQWLLLGQGLAFGRDLFGGLVGVPDGALFGLRFEPRGDLATTIPESLFLTFQMLAAAFAAALVASAGAERARFASTAVFVLLWTTLVYDPVAHWVWSPEGWLWKFGARDFAGGLVVHATAGVGALCVAVAVGKRRGADVESLHPHNLTLTAIGTTLLWLGWIGFNVGRAWGVSPGAAAAFAATLFGGAAGMAAWSLVEYATTGKATFLGACTGIVAGLVGGSAAAGYVAPPAAAVLGATTALIVHGAILVKGRLAYDDSLDVFGVHGVGGIVGALGLGLLADSALDPGVVGLFEGRTELMLAQLVAVAVVVAYTAVMTSAILFVVDRAMGLRVSPEDEELGLDLAQHGQRGYVLGEGERAFGEFR